MKAKAGRASYVAADKVKLYYEQEHDEEDDVEDKDGVEDEDDDATWEGRVISLLTR